MAGVSLGLLDRASLTASKCVWIGSTEHFEGIIGDSVMAYMSVLLHVSISK